MIEAIIITALVTIVITSGISYAIYGSILDGKKDTWREKKENFEYEIRFLKSLLESAKDTIKEKTTEVTKLKVELEKRRGFKHDDGKGESLI